MRAPHLSDESRLGDELIYFVGPRQLTARSRVCVCVWGLKSHVLPTARLDEAFAAEDAVDARPANIPPADRVAHQQSRRTHEHPGRHQNDDKVSPRGLSGVSVGV